MSMTQLLTNFYGQKQNPHESVETFLLQKRVLFHRLAAPGNNKEFIRLAFTQIRPGLRSRLRVQRFTHPESFLEIAAQIPRPQVIQKHQVRKESAP